MDEKRIKIAEQNFTNYLKCRPPGWKYFLFL